MFRKLHIHMTVFSVLITGTILAVMAMVCLFITENSIRENHNNTFTSNAYSCISYLESQTVLSHRRILQSQGNYDMKMQVWDNGQSLFFHELQSSPEDDALFEKAVSKSAASHNLDLMAADDTATLTRTAFFSLPEHFVCAAKIPRDNGTLSAVFLFSLDGLSRQLMALRLTFLISVAAAVCALAVFSWFFTRRMIRPLEESQKRQTQFIASASHELRSPLTVMLSNLQAMKHASPEEAEHFSDVIQSEGTRMSRLIGDMLSLANADNQSWTIHPALCELDTLLLETYEKYEPLMREKALSLFVELPETAMPPCSCDRERISQVLNILLDNCMAYVPAGKEVRLSLRQEETSFSVTVTDNGPGIPDESKPLIFQRFYRADKSRKDKQHFGLGLCIALEILRLHKGRITLSDTPGGGAQFTLTLPR